jgi:hypothetical protein
MPVAAIKGEDEISSLVRTRIMGLLSKNDSQGGGLDLDVLNLVTTPEYNNLRGNIINHLKRTTVQEDAEGKAGRSPEESLFTGRRSQIRFAPTMVMPAHNMNLKKKSNLRSRGALKLRNMMNSGSSKVGTSKIPGSGKSKDGETPMGAGLKKAVQRRHRKKPGTLYNKRKVSCDECSSNTMKGLHQKSKDNFKNKKKRESRQKLDVSGY